MTKKEYLNTSNELMMPSEMKWNEKNTNTAEQRTRVNKLSSNFVVSSFRFIAQIKSENQKNTRE